MATAEKVPAPESAAICVVAAYQLKLLDELGTENHIVAGAMPNAKSTVDADSSGNRTRRVPELRVENDGGFTPPPVHITVLNVPLLKLIVLVVPPVRLSVPPVKVSVTNVGLGFTPMVTTGPGVTVMSLPAIMEFITPGAVATRP
jgi:hypothetical protein